jgi:hypothetical protein
MPRDVPHPLGLAVVLDKRGKPRHSVRGIVVYRKHLYVADEAGDAVKVFSVKSGELVAHVKNHALEAPVHLLLHGETLARWSCRQPRRAASSKHAWVIDGKLDAPSGFGFGPDGDLYVAERKKQRVRRFSRKGKKKGTFIDDLPDMPEFLVYVP